MSWLTEEWKDRLPQDALSNIQTMETTLEKFQKDLAQYSFKTDSLEIANNNVKQKLDEKTKEVQLLEREKLSLETKLDEYMLKLKNLEASLKRKENEAHDFNERLSYYKEKTDSQRTEINKLENELESLQSKYGMDSQQAKEGSNKLNEAHEIVKQQMEELKRRLENVTREKREQELSYENKLQSELSKESQLREEIECLSKQVNSLELKNQVTESEKKNILLEKDELETEVGRPSEENQENEELKDTIRNKQSEIYDLKSKLSEVNDHNPIGGYLGIDVKKICSDSKLIEKEKSELFYQNRTLQEEVTRLNQMLDEYSARQRRDMTEHILGVNPVSCGQDIDSGVALRGESVFCGENVNEREILISRIETNPDLDKCDEEMSKEGHDGPLQEDGSEHFQHGVQCFLTSQKIFELTAILSSYKQDNTKIKGELHQMKEVYENHMKICAQQNKISRKSSDRLMVCNSQDGLIDDLRTKLSEEEKIRQELLMVLQEKESQCMILKEKLSFSGAISANATNKLEELVDIIVSNNKNNNNNCYSSSSGMASCPPEISSDLQRFLSDLSTSFLSFHEEIMQENQEARKVIQSTVEKILSQLHLLLEKRNRRHSDSYNFPDFSTGNSVHSKPCSGNSIEELESIKDRIGSVQQIIYSYANETRRIEEERDHMQEELIKMVDVMKTKDAEFGRLKNLYGMEKRKVDDNDSCFRREMDELKREQLEIYQEYREMCDTLKKKEIELLNKSKQLKLFTAEWREKEDELNEKISKLEQENTRVDDEKTFLQKELDEKSLECELLVEKLVHADEKIRTIFNNLSRVEDMFYKAKTQGLYK